MNCIPIRRALPGYVDGALGLGWQAAVHQHVAGCDSCREELASYRRVAQMVTQVEPAAPPPDLALRIRVQLSRQRAAGPEASGLRRVASRAGLLFHNLLAPVALPATGGASAAVLSFVLVLHALLVGVPLGAVPNDVPIWPVQNAQLLSLAPFPILHETEGGTSGGSAELLLVEATVNARGDAVGYEILYGPDGTDVRRHLDQVMLFSRFRPQQTFGRPTSGGRVRMVLSFREIRVRG